MASYRGALPQLQAISPYMPQRMGDMRVNPQGGALPADTSGQDGLNKGAGALGKGLGALKAAPAAPAGVNFGGPTTFSGNIGAWGQGGGMLGPSGDTLAFAPGGTQFSTSLGAPGVAGSAPNFAAAGSPAAASPGAAAMFNPYTAVGAAILANEIQGPNSGRRSENLGTHVLQTATGAAPWQDANYVAGKLGMGGKNNVVGAGLQTMQDYVTGDWKNAWTNFKRMF